MSSVCTICNGKGMPDICKGCGEQSYTPAQPIPEATELDFRIPSYYKVNLWESNKMVMGTDVRTDSTLTILDKLVRQVREGKLINRSYGFLLPHFHGKKTAMFTIMQEYLGQGRTVAPAVDIVSLAILENNFTLNKKEAVEEWTNLVTSDLVCVYGVDFSARYQTAKLYSNLASIRGLRGKPTLLFASNGLDDLRSRYIGDNLTDLDARQDNGCPLSNPWIIDGVPNK